MRRDYDVNRDARSPACHRGRQAASPEAPATIPLYIHAIGNLFGGLVVGSLFGGLFGILAMLF